VAVGVGRLDHQVPADDHEDGTVDEHDRPEHAQYGHRADVEEAEGDLQGDPGRRQRQQGDQPWAHVRVPPGVLEREDDPRNRRERPEDDRELAPEPALAVGSRDPEDAAHAAEGRSQPQDGQKHRERRRAELVPRPGDVQACPAQHGADEHPCTEQSVDERRHCATLLPDQ